MDTIQDIKDRLTQKWMSNPEVISKYGLDTNKTFEEQFSKISQESIIFYNVAYEIWLREKSLANWRTDIDATALATRYGTKEWWHKTALAWQDGDMTEVIDGAVGYSIIDQSKQKIKFCAVIEEGRTLYLKVAKGSIGSLSALTTEELGRFQAYLNDVKPLGIRAVGLSYPADSVTIMANIYYDGERSLTDVESEVEIAIDNYIASVVFGGEIYCSKMVDAIQSISGIKDVHNLQIAIGGVWQSRKAVPKAGYAKVGGYGIHYFIED